MATMATVSISVHMYGTRTCCAVLWLLARLAPVLRLCLTMWLAKTALRWLVWVRVGNHWWRPMQDASITVCRGAATTCHEEVA